MIFQNLVERKEPVMTYNSECPQVRQHHSFFWDTKLSLERMEEISGWIGGLSPKERGLLDDLLDDIRKATEFDCFGD